MNLETKTEYETAKVRWTEQDLRRYLLSLSYNSAPKDYCLAQLQYPYEISLNRAWQETMDEMRSRTVTTRREYWTLIGTSDKRDRIMLSTQFAHGSQSEIPSAIKSEKMARARSEGIP